MRPLLLSSSAVADALLKIGIAAGILLGFVVYMILSEDIHWRFHMGE